LGSRVQYRGNPSRRVGFLVEARTLTNFPLKFLYEDWKRVNRALLGAPFKETRSLLLMCLTSKKYKKISTDDEIPNCAHKIIKARMNA